MYRTLNLRVHSAFTLLGIRRTRAYFPECKEKKKKKEKKGERKRKALDHVTSNLEGKMLRVIGTLLDALNVVISNI